MSSTRNFKARTANQILPINCINDSKSLHNAVYSKTLTEKRLKIELCAICKSLEKGEIHSVAWVNSSDQLADCLTKEGVSSEKLYVLNGNSNNKLLKREREKKAQKISIFIEHIVVNDYFVILLL